MTRLCQIIGCKKTTTLAHHPTGNAAIERLWQWVASCLKQMTNDQYSHWEDYVRLMEHVWNTTYHSVLQCTPFEAAHGLPARSALDSLTAEASSTPAGLMTKDGITAMRETAEAFKTHINNVRTEAAERNAELNKRGVGTKYKVGDEVSLFIPPSEKEAKAMGRKPKHLLYYRGPAFVTKVLSNSTYQLEFEGRIYYRCMSELRPYKSDKLPVDLPIANDIKMQDKGLVIGNYVSLCDSNDENDDHFHLCEVIAIEDGKAVLLNYGTWQNNIKTAKFSILYQEHNTGRYTTQKPLTRAREQEVLDRVDLEEADDYIDHYNIQVTKAGKICAKSVKQLTKLGLKHHVLGRTFP